MLPGVGDKLGFFEPRPLARTAWTSSIQRPTANYRRSPVAGNRLEQGTFASRDARRKTRSVLFSSSELYRQWSSGNTRGYHLDEGQTPARTTLCGATCTLRRSPIHRGVRLAWVGWDSLACGDTQHGRGVHALRTGASPVSAATQRTAIRAYG